MTVEDAKKRIEELSQSRLELLAQLNAVEGAIMEYENFIIPKLEEVKNES